MDGVVMWDHRESLNRLFKVSFKFHHCGINKKNLLYIGQQPVPDALLMALHIS